MGYEFACTSEGSCKAGVFGWASFSVAILDDKTERELYRAKNLDEGFKIEEEEEEGENRGTTTPTRIHCSFGVLVHCMDGDVSRCTWLHVDCYLPINAIYSSVLL